MNEIPEIFDYFFQRDTTYIHINHKLASDTSITSYKKNLLYATSQLHIARFDGRWGTWQPTAPPLDPCTREIFDYIEQWKSLFWPTTIFRWNSILIGLFPWISLRWTPWSKFHVGNLRTKHWIGTSSSLCETQNWSHKLLWI